MWLNMLFCEANRHRAAARARISAARSVGDNGTVSVVVAMSLHWDFGQLTPDTKVSTSSRLLYGRL